MMFLFSAFVYLSLSLFLVFVGLLLNALFLDKATKRFNAS